MHGDRDTIVSPSQFIGKQRVFSSKKFEKLEPKFLRIVNIKYLLKASSLGLEFLRKNLL